jgi:hypothetical protein
LTRFVERIWADASLGVFEDWELANENDEYPFWLTTTFSKINKKVKTRLDLNLSGQLLVNNKPFGKLPREILSHEDYKRFFRDFDFETHPSSGGNDAYVSWANDKKSSYTFFLKGRDLVVLERIMIKGDAENENEIIKQLIPHTLVEEHFPEMFTVNYSHWLNKKTNCIEFKSRYYSDYQKASLGNNVDYFFDLKDLSMKSIKDEQLLIDIKSRTFKSIVKFTNRLDDAKHVHVFIRMNCPNEVHIKMPRLNLNFKIDLSKKCIKSEDFKGKNNLI